MYKYTLLGLALTLAACQDAPKNQANPPEDPVVTPDDDKEPKDEPDDKEDGPECGDGHLDAGEQCDDGAANGATADCNESCEFNGFVTCDMVSGPKATLDTSTAQPDGNFHLMGQFAGSTGLDSSCATVTQDVAVTLTLPADGTFRVTTGNRNTNVATAISLRSDCDTRSEVACEVGNDAEANGAQTFVHTGMAGDTWTVLVQNLGADDGFWHLSLEPVIGTAQLGDACDTDIPCEDGLCSDGTCLTDDAPMITASSITQTDSWEMMLSIDGTDANLDVDHVVIASFTDIVGDVWGDTPDELPLVAQPTLTWTGTTFTATWYEGVTFPGTGLGDIDTADIQVADRAGNLSAPVTVTWPTPVSRDIQAYIGDACDMCIDCAGNDSGFPDYCDPNPHADPNDSTVEIVGLQCTWDSTNTTSTCQDRNLNEAPVANGATMVWEGPQAVLHFNGYDAAHGRGMTVHIEAELNDGTIVDVDSPFTPVHWDRGNFSGVVDFDTEGLTDVAHLSVVIEDNTSPNQMSESIQVAWVDSVPPVTVAQGDQCDLNGWDSVCADPYVCSPTLSGVPGCMDSAAPVLVDATGAYTGGFFSQFALSFTAEDANADWNAVMARNVGGGTVALTHDGFDTQWSEDPFGQTLYTGDTVVPYGDWIYEVWVEDADGNVSNSEVVLGVPADLAAGDSCNIGVCSFRGCTAPTSYCDVSSGMTCSNREGIAGPETVCELGLAPTLDNVVVHRTGTDTFRVEFTGTDANGDAKGIRLTQTEGSTVTHPNVTIDFAAPMEGQTSFSSAFNGKLTDTTAATTLELAIQDWGFLASGSQTVTVPPLRMDGETCSNDDTIDRCQDGAECMNGTCFAYAPSLSSATLTWENFGRDAVVTVTGFDDKTGNDTQLRKAIVTLGDVTIDKTLSKYGITWDGNEFSFEVDVKGAGLGALVGESFVSVEVVDVGGFSDDALFFITPHRALNQPCDTTGMSNTCHAGLTCDTTDEVCVNDAVDPCAGVPLTVATDQTVKVDTSTGTKLDSYPDYDTCGSGAAPKGKEAAIEYTATQAGTLVITATDDPSDGSVIHSHLYVRSGECVNYDAMATCDNDSMGSNETRLAVEAGEVLYVMVDGGTWPSGGPVDVAFSYE